MKILFLVPYPTEGPSNRFRVEQYLPYLRKAGYEYRISAFWSREAYSVLYNKGYYFKKIFYFFTATLRRAADIMSVPDYDIVFIHRESYPIGPPLFEWLIYLFKKPIIFDFDDAIFIQNYNPANKFYRFFKSYSKIRYIIRMSSAVIVANGFLKQYAEKYNKLIYIIPTAIDTDRFSVKKRYQGPLIIGWIGSPTATPYLKLIFGVMQRLSYAHDFVLRIVGGSRAISIPGVNVENRKWQLETEVEDFHGIDIGIYPLPDNLWARGKAAFKAIQYMSTGIPVVASPVGMTQELIHDGVNGFLADSEDEWVCKVSNLLQDERLRERIGLAGRKVVEERYSIKVNAPKILNILKILCK